MIFTRFAKLMFIALSLGSSFSFAGPRDTGGGDDFGLEFSGRAISALRRLPQLGISSETVNVEELVKVAGEATYLTVDEPLAVSLADSDQSCVAVNIRSAKTIKINRARWKAIGDDRVKDAIALHEVLSLREIESTGKYTISARYLSSVGLTVSVFARQAQGIRVGKAQYIFDSVDDLPDGSRLFNRPRMLLASGEIIEVEPKRFFWKRNHGFCIALGMKTVVNWMNRTDVRACRGACGESISRGFEVNTDGKIEMYIDAGSGFGTRELLCR